VRCPGLFGQAQLGFFHCGFDFLLPAFRLFADDLVKPFDMARLAFKKEEHSLRGEPVLFGFLLIDPALAYNEFVQRENFRLALCRNRGFYPFRKDNADAWVIFPYDILEGQATEIGWKDFKERFPKTGAYLEERKRKLLKAVDAEKGTNRWHLYKYPKNLASQANPKVLFPSTIEDTLAAVDEEGDVYQDNVRMNSISFSSATTDQLKSLACLFNSTVFSALARLKSWLSDSGWRQFNRQYAELVPFPAAIIRDTAVVRTLSGFADRISELQTKSVASETEGAKTGFRATIESLWQQLDDAVETVYGLTRAQKEVLRKYPRRVNRFDLLARQAVVNEDDE
jgi:hypothetical protein